MDTICSEVELRFKTNLSMWVVRRIIMNVCACPYERSRQYSFGTFRQIYSRSSMYNMEAYG
jgi:hypothetical protein